jgi:acyl transferase domain-containing protein/acyl carrier protein
MNASNRVPLAVVGIGAAFAHAGTLRAFWRTISTGEDCIQEVPRHRWLPEDYYDPDPRVTDKTYATRGSFLSGVNFDAAKYGVPPKLLEHTDASQLLSLVVADNLLGNLVPAAFQKVDRDRICVVMGVANGTQLLCEMAGRTQRPIWYGAMLEQGISPEMANAICDRICDSVPDWSEASFPGLLGNVVSGRIANRLDLRGVNFTTDAACASSLSSLAAAAKELETDGADLAIAGGVDATNDAFTFMCFSKTPALSPTGDCRPFSVDADGTILGEGVGMVALRRLPDAVRDGDRIYGVIRGIGSSSDGRSTSVYAPLPAGQARALRLAYQNAGYGPESVGLVEAHGTGTMAGDEAELRALMQVFGEASERSHWCALGSIKSQIGHTKAASGVASLIKAVMALHHKVLPPTIKVSRPRRELESDSSPFYLNTATRPWITGPSTPRRASVSSFGFGGVNFHMTLEEHGYDPSAPNRGRTRALSSELVLLGATNRDAMRVRCDELSKARLPDGALVHLARESQQAFDASSGARLGVTARDEADLQELLRLVVQQLDKLDTNDASLELPQGLSYSELTPSNDVAVLFPGQGSQYLGMGGALACEFDAARAVWDREADLPVGPRALHELVYPKPSFAPDAAQDALAELTETQWAQPAIGAASLSTWALLSSLQLRPTRLIGHSFGELSALCAAGVWSERDLLAIARLRGECMAAAKPGTMLAITAKLSEVGALLQDVGGELVIANHNSPTQVIVAGPIAAIEALVPVLTAKGLRSSRLTVSAAFHSPLMDSARAALEKRIGDFPATAPSIDVWSCARMQSYPRDVTALREIVTSSIVEPVRFSDSVEAAYAAGTRVFVELAPSAVLSGLVDRILDGKPHRTISLDRKGADGTTSLFRGLGQLAVSGCQLDFTGLWSEFTLDADPRATPPSLLSMRVDSRNIGRKYPPLNTPPRKHPSDKPAMWDSPTAKRVVVAPPKEASSTSVSDAVSPAAATGQPPAASFQPVYAGGGDMETRSLNEVVMRDTNGHGESVGNGTHNGASAAPGAYAHHDPYALGNWLTAVNEMNRLTTEVHAVYQRVMGESHMAFLQVSEASMAGLLSMGPYALGAGASAPLALPSHAAPSNGSAEHHHAPRALGISRPGLTLGNGGGLGSLSATSSFVQHAPMAMAAPAAVHFAPAPAPAYAPVQHQAPVQHAAPVQHQAPVQQQAPAQQPRPYTNGNSTHHAAPAPVAAPAPAVAAVAVAPVAAAATASTESAAGNGHASRALKGMMARNAELSPEAREALDAGDYENLLRVVIAEKTGYPKEVLTMEMDFEADLGIDSIKRVEILASLQEVAPVDIEGANPQELMQLRTIGQVLEFVKTKIAEAALAPGAVTS